MSVPENLLRQPLVWRQPVLAPLLADLQANILKGHGRPHAELMLLRFDPARRTSIRAALAALELTSATHQLEDAERRRTDAKFDGGPVVLLFLTARGYDALGVASARVPGGAAFTAGMAAREALGDPSSQDWEDGYREGADAMLLVADGSLKGTAAAAASAIEALTTAGARIAARETGAALFRDGAGIEHFGYVDGRSQPLMLDDEVVRELNQQGEPFVWDPRFGPLDVALVSDPGGAGPNSYGSFLVFRKLEQDVAGFKSAEDGLADALDLMAPDARELAGALVVGRFEDGTPVVASKRALGAAHVANNFVYDGDPGGARCPFQSHIRKTNPRGGTVPLGATLADERSRLMPRRGITYGARAPDLGDRPAKGVGLLFMAYNRDIERQFEFTQAAWANDDAFPRSGTGRDPVIGSGAAGHLWPKSWDHPEAGTLASDFSSHVTLLGGEYFFAPSLSFVGGLALRPD
ncbi:peroxidase [Sphingomonas sp. CFBP 13714]|uniref:Dyp-type peroxidase n=1 Tax=Sphingomonas sp. CFBP 13714 TaxID=2775308 RepID=UPI00177B0058|nr:peroxidase [Sphingomonas sp. CFBP 13714]MBD8700592.1 peroxidase [Sphingomonas sp. CFBP 13714]